MTSHLSSHLSHVVVGQRLVTDHHSTALSDRFPRREKKRNVSAKPPTTNESEISHQHHHLPSFNNLRKAGASLSLERRSALVIIFNCTAFFPKSNPLCWGGGAYISGTPPLACPFATGLAAASTYSPIISATTARCAQ